LPAIAAAAPSVGWPAAGPDAARKVRPDLGLSDLPLRALAQPAAPNGWFVVAPDWTVRRPPTQALVWDVYVQSVLVPVQTAPAAGWVEAARGNTWVEAARGNVWVAGSADGMAVQIIPKTVEENLTYFLDAKLLPEIVAGDTLSSVVGIVVSPIDGTLTLGTPSISGTQVQVQISGGTLDTTYSLKAKVNLASGKLRTLGGKLRIFDYTEE
jgi:hypothetical protein